MVFKAWFCLSTGDNTKIKAFKRFTPLKLFFLFEIRNIFVNLVQKIIFHKRMEKYIEIL